MGVAPAASHSTTQVTMRRCVLLHVAITAVRGGLRIVLHLNFEKSLPASANNLTISFATLRRRSSTAIERRFFLPLSQTVGAAVTVAATFCISWTVLLVLLLLLL